MDNAVYSSKQSDTSFNHNPLGIFLATSDKEDFQPYRLLNALLYLRRNGIDVSAVLSHRLLPNLVHRCISPHCPLSQQLRYIDRSPLQRRSFGQLGFEPRSQASAALLHPAAAPHHSQTERAGPDLPARRRVFTQTHLQRQREVPDSPQKDGSSR